MVELNALAGWWPRLALAAGVALSLADPAPAQGVVIYGVVDLAIERLNATAASGAALHRMPSLTGSVPSRLGFRGTEDLGGGLKAMFTLEQGLGADTGGLAQGGRAFGRQAFVGLSGPWGQVSLGRQTTMLFWSLLDADIIGPSAYSMASLDSYVPNARHDNALAWRGSFGAWTLGASTSLGRDAVNAGPSPAGTQCPGEADDRRACRQHSAMLKFDTARWGLALVGDRFSGGPGAFAGLVDSSLQDTRLGANGYVRTHRLKLGGGLIRRHNEAQPARARSTLAYLGLQWQAAPTLGGR
jgi:predicted porin